MPNTADNSPMARGMPVDRLGGPTIDPTKNVLDLVQAESKYQDAMRGELTTLINEKVASLKELVKVMSDSVVAFQNAQVYSETRRIDQLAQTRQEFQNTIRDMLAESVRTTSTLVSTQLVQIQATFDTRVSKLEAGAFTQAGKQSVADPAISDALSRMASGMTQIKQDTDERLTRMATANVEQMGKLTAAITVVGQKGLTVEGTRMGQSQVIAWIVGAAMLLAAIATPLVALLSRAH